MKLELVFLFLLLFSFSFSYAAKYKYWLVIKDSSFVYKDYKGTKYVYPKKNYTYMVMTNSNIQGSGVGEFTINTLNGIFTTNGNSGRPQTQTQIYVNENMEFTVQWNDVVDTCNVKIGKATAYVTGTDTLNSKVPILFSYRIASLKGQTPVIGISSNPPIGNTQTITAQIVTEVTYPNLYKSYSVLTGWANIPAEYYEWTLPPNWKATNQTGSTFILGADQKSITITPDHVTAGEIKIRALNSFKTAGSDIESNTLDRGFSFTTAPTSITFGDLNPKTFTTTLFSGITYEWKVPTGWQINGQGNTLQGLNLNSVAITPSFCNLTDDKIYVRLKYGTEVSDWYTPSNYQGVLTPSAKGVTPTVYQYENTSYTISDIYSSNVSSVTWSGDGVIVSSSNGINAKLVFTKTGLLNVKASILLNGCTTPIVKYSPVTVQPYRLSISGANQICNSEDYTIKDLPSDNNVVWSVNPINIVSLQSVGNDVSVEKVNSNKVTLSAVINNVFTLTKEVSVGTPFSLGINSYSNLTMWDAGNFQVLPGSGYYPYEGTLSVSDVAGIAINYSWSFVSSTSGKPAYWWANGNSVDIAMKQTNTFLTLKCTASDTCGSYSQFYTFTSSDLIPMLITPNPATTEAEVSIADDNNTVTSTNPAPPSYTVTVVDSYGSTVYSNTTKEKKFKIRTASFRNGMYAVTVSDGINVFQRKLMVNH